MNAQEIFDKVASYLINDEGMCQYRTEDGNRCAVGYLIPDHLYSPKMEGSIVSLNKLVKDALTEAGVDLGKSDVFYLLRSLQRAHDDRAHATMRFNKFDIAQRLRAVADEHYLYPGVLLVP